MPSAAIAPVGLSSGEVLPGVFLEINFAQGPSPGSGLQRQIVVLANKLPTGSATVDTVLYGPDTPTQLSNESHMIALAGAGSEAHRMFRRMAAIAGEDGGPNVYWVFVAESAGAKANGTITLATTATGSATFRVYVGDEFADVSVEATNTPTTVAAAMVAAINAKTHWPVTASNALGVITLTAKQNGLRGNWIRYQAAMLALTSPGMTTTAQTDAFLTGGTTADSNTTALATINPRWFAYIVSAAEDATQLGALASQVGTQALAMNGLRQSVYAGSVDTLANVTTIAVGINNPRVEISWQEKNPLTPAELAANAAMVYAIEEADELAFRTNFIEYGNDAVTQTRWKVPGPRLDTARPSKANIRSALTNGITPIGVNPSGTTYIVDRFTTRSLNGSQPDGRIREAHKRVICDRFADVLSTRLRNAMAGAVIGDDPPNGVAPPPKTVTPRLVKIGLFRTLDEFANNSKIQTGIDPTTGEDRLERQKLKSRVERQLNPSSRMGLEIPLETIDNWRQSAVIVNQVA